MYVYNDFFGWKKDEKKTLKHEKKIWEMYDSCSVVSCTHEESEKISLVIRKGLKRGSK